MASLGWIPPGQPSMEPIANLRRAATGTVRRRKL
jgi:hypothetical protein